VGEVELKRRKLQAEIKTVLLDEVDKSLTVSSEHDADDVG
jgi:protein required for attachment to host cells